MKCIFIFLVYLCVMIGCSTCPNKISKDGSYRADMMIGQKRELSLEVAEVVFGEPKQVGIIFENSNYEVELRRYTFTNVSDFVMYFHEGIFIQAGLMPVESPKYPSLRADYQSISAEKPGPVLGYTVLMNKDEVVLDTIQP